jgi:uncharacterized membrane protein YfcA
MDGSALGWAIPLGTGVAILAAASVASARDMEPDWPLMLLLTVAYLAGAIVGLTLAFGSLGEGLGSALTSLILFVPTIRVMFGSRG